MTASHTTVIVRRSVGTLGVVAALALWGPKPALVAMPNPESRVITVRVSALGQDPESLAATTVHTVSEALRGVTGVEEVDGITVSGGATVRLFLAPDTRLETAHARVREVLDALRTPADVTVEVAPADRGPRRSMVVTLDDVAPASERLRRALLDADPPVDASLAGLAPQDVDDLLRAFDRDTDGALSPDELTRAAGFRGLGVGALRGLQDTLVNPAITAVRGVAEVETLGGATPALHIDVDPDRLRALALSLHDVARALMNANPTPAHAQPTSEDVARQVRFTVPLTEATDLLDVPIGVSPDGTMPLLLRQVASAEVGPGPRAGGLDVSGHGDAVGAAITFTNTDDDRRTSKRVRAALAHVAQRLPKGAVVRVLSDRSRVSHAAMRGLQILLAGLPLAVLGLSLPRARVLHTVSRLSQLMALLALPAVLALAGVTVSAVALAAVVGAGLFAAALTADDGDGGAGRGVVAGVATAGALAAQVWVGDPLSVGVAATALAAVVVVTAAIGLGGWRPLAAAPKSRPTLATAAPIVCVALLALAVSLQGYRLLAPAPNTAPLRASALTLQTFTPPGLPPSAALLLAQDLDAALVRHPFVRSAVSISGRSASFFNPADLLQIDTAITLVADGPQRPGPAQDALIQDLNALIGHPGTTTLWTTPQRARAYDMADRLSSRPAVRAPTRAAASQAASQLRHNLQAGGISLPPELTQPTLDVRLRRADAARFGLSAAAVQHALQDARGGRVVTTVTTASETLPVVLRLAGPPRDDLQRLRRTPVPTPLGNVVALGQVADLSYAEGPPFVYTIDGDALVPLPLPPGALDQAPATASPLPPSAIVQLPAPLRATHPSPHGALLALLAGLLSPLAVRTRRLRDAVTTGTAVALVAAIGVGGASTAAWVCGYPSGATVAVAAALAGGFGASAATRALGGTGGRRARAQRTAFAFATGLLLLAITGTLNAVFGGPLTPAVSALLAALSGGVVASTVGAAALLGVTQHPASPPLHVSPHIPTHAGGGVPGGL